MVRKVKVSGTRKRSAAVGKRKTTHRRRRRISGTGDLSGMAERAGGLVLGAVGAREVNTLGVKVFPSLTPTMSALLQMALGFALPKFVKGSFFQAVGDGMIANGGMVLVVSTGIVNGVGAGGRAYMINGTSNLKVVAGTGNLKVVNGPTTRVSNNPTNVPVRRFKNYV